MHRRTFIPPLTIPLFVLVFSTLCVGILLLIFRPGGFLGTQDRPTTRKPPLCTLAAIAEACKEDVATANEACPPGFAVGFVPTRTFPSFCAAIYESEETALAEAESHGHELKKTGIWETISVDAIRPVLVEGCSQGGLFIDVGGYTGYYAFLAASLGCRVHVWEPVNHKALQAGICANGFSSRVTLHRAVCSPSHSPVRVSGTFMDGHVTNSYQTGDLSEARAAELHPDSDNHSVEVPSLPIDDVIDEDVVLMKVDVEGFEPQVFQSAERLLRTRHVPNILMEYNLFRAMTRSQGIQMLSSFLAMKYSIRDLKCTGQQALIDSVDKIQDMTNALHNGTYPCSEWATDLLLSRNS